MKQRFLVLCLLFSCLLASNTQAAAPDAPLDLIIRGVPEDLENNISLHIGKLPAPDTEPAPRLYRRLQEAITQACQALGYYQCRFSHRLEGHRLLLDIDAAGEVLWQTPDLQIPESLSGIASIARLISQHPFQSGKRIRHSEFDHFKRQLLLEAQEAGFLDTRYRESRLLIDREKGLAIARLVITSGDRYRLHSLSFSGSRLHSDFLRRLSPIQEGDYVQRSKISELQRNLQNTRYFSEIDVSSKNTRGSTSTDITATLVDAPRHQFGAGLGFGTDTGPRTRLRWTQPHFTRSGHRWVTEGRLSAPIRQLNTHYRIPLQDPLKKSLNVSLDWTEKHIEDTTSELSQINASLDNQISDTWFISYGAGFEWENFRQGSQSDQRVAYLVPRFRFLRTTVPTIADPVKGSRTALTAMVSGQDLGADTNFLRLTLMHKRLVSLGGNRLLIIRGEVGAIATDDLLLIPASKRFFTGGDQTVRGFRYESIATADNVGELIGGKYLNAGSVEYSDKFARQWRAAIFADTGRAYSDSDESWRRGAGVGLRWLSPVGQISMDVAFPINDDKQHGPRLHLVMGVAL